MIANIGSARNHYDECLKTLLCASRIKNIVNFPRVNEVDPKTTFMLGEYKSSLALIKVSIIVLTNIIILVRINLPLFSTVVPSRK